MNTKATTRDSDALSPLPDDIRADVIKAVADAGLHINDVTDVRLRRGGNSYISCGERSYALPPITDERFDELIFTLTGGSLYAHADTIREGYINARGVRCGVCGRAALDGGRIREVSGITSVSIRIRHDVPGCADCVHAILRRRLTGVLVYSPPGVGKTTLLRDLIRSLSREGVQFSVVDCRGELADACRGTSADVLSDYPKSDGIRAAVRSLSPQLIICDELSGREDADAAMYAHSCGVPIVATSHAASVDELKLRTEMTSLCDARVFTHLVGLYREGGAVRHIITKT